MSLVSFWPVEAQTGPFPFSRSPGISSGTWRRSAMHTPWVWHIAVNTVWLELFSFCVILNVPPLCLHCSSLFVFINSAVTFLQIGCNAVSWAPAVVPGSLIDQPSGQKPNYVKRFVSGGCDNLVKLWKYAFVQWTLCAFEVCCVVIRESRWRKCEAQSHTGSLMSISCLTSGFSLVLKMFYL